MFLEGRIFDVYPLTATIVVWVHDASHRAHRLEHVFSPLIYAAGSKRDLAALAASARRHGSSSQTFMTHRKDFWTGKEREVLAIRIPEYEKFQKLQRKFIHLADKIEFFNADFMLGQAYFYEHNLFPTARCRIIHDGKFIQQIECLEDPWAEPPALDEYVIMRLTLEDDSPLGRRTSLLSVECEGDCHTIEGGKPEELLENLNRLLDRYDPDIILTEQGDGFIFPNLFSSAQKLGVRLRLDRDAQPVRRKIITRGKSYVSYGKIQYKGPSYPLFGRIHVDSLNSFFVGESGLDGLFMEARVAQLPLQYAARTSPGTAISSMQVAEAVRSGILVPWRKGQPEQPKTALQLLKIDKGGLVFQPDIGIHDDVAELDFVSMYPALMVSRNISPETVLCPCCRNHVVPDAHYNICERRVGLVPKVLKPLIEHRARFKAKRNQSEGEEKERYDRRQTALKWCLVTCFGYLGYKNARFGRIEAHESVTAFGRQVLLQTKEICEAHGCRLLHAVTDAVYIQKNGLSDEELVELTTEIERVTRIPIALEGRYYWMVFLPSKVRSTRPVPNRFFGLFHNGDLKCRGIAHRRRDTPHFIAQTQLEMLALVSQGRNAQEYIRYCQQALERLERAVDLLQQSEVHWEELVIAKKPSREFADYEQDTMTTVAGEQLARNGVHIQPGQTIEYVIKDARAKRAADRVKAAALWEPTDRYDVEKYVELLLDAGAEILWPAGWTKEALEESFAGGTLFPLTGSGQALRQAQDK